MESQPTASAGLAATIRAARRGKGWSQQDLADRSGVSRPTIARLEGGSSVSYSTVTKLAEALDLRLALEAR